ncbi:MAG: transporter associated domain-containing protein [Phycisphaerales bacterium]
MTRLPVVKTGEDIDHGVLGLLDVKRYLVAAAKAPGASSSPGPSEGAKVTEFMEPVRYVPGSGSLDKLLEQFASAGVKLGLVVDEHGAVTGIVSTENVVQRLIAELTSDEDVELEAQVRHLPDGRWSVPGRLSVRDWASMFGLTGMGQERVGARVSTVAGLIFTTLGRVPRVGDVVTVGNLRLQVLAMAGEGGRVVGAAAVSLVGKSDVGGGNRKSEVGEHERAMKTEEGGAL